MPYSLIIHYYLYQLGMQKRQRASSSATIRQRPHGAKFEWRNVAADFEFEVQRECRRCREQWSNSKFIPSLGDLVSKLEAADLRFREKPSGIMDLPEERFPCNPTRAETE